MCFNISTLYATTLTYSIFFPPTHAQTKVAHGWANEIEKRSNGRIKINIFAGGSLTPAPQCFDGTEKGISDIGMSAFSYTKGRFPIMEALDLPLGYKSGRIASSVANEYFKSKNPKELKSVKVLYVHAHGPGLLHTTLPVKSLSDIKNMKIRATGTSAQIVNALGGVAVAMSQGETYEAISKGIVSGTFGPMEVLKGWKQGEVIKSTTNCNAIGYTTGFFVAMNIKKWNALPKDVQKIFTDVSEQWVDIHGKAWDNADLEGSKYSVGLGNKIENLSKQEEKKWQQAIKVVLEDYKRNTKSNGIDGAKTIKEIEALIKKYSLKFR